MPIFFALQTTPPWLAAGYAGLGGFIAWFSTFGPGSIEAAERLGASGFASWLLVIGCCVYEAVPCAIAAWLCGARRRQPRWQRALVFVALWTIVLSWYPDLLPGNIAHSLYQAPRMIQLLDLGGLPLLTSVVLLPSAFLAEALGSLRRAKLRAALFVIAAAAVPALVAAFGTWRLTAVAEAPATALRVGFVQPAAPVDDLSTGQLISKAERQSEFERMLAATDRLATQEPDLDLLLWPEVPFALEPGGEVGARIGEILALAKAHGVPLVLAGNGYDGVGTNAPLTSRLFTASADGTLGPSYDKMILVPFTEYLPFDGLIPGLRDIFTLAHNYKAGDDAVPLAVTAKAKLIPAICYESISRAISARRWRAAAI